jgi:hypothetical protein
MSQKASDRDLAIVAYRNAGHTTKETAEHFGLGLERIRFLERRTRDYLEAEEELKSDPDNILLLARTGHIAPLSASGMAKVGIHQLSQLAGLTLRDLLMMPSVNRRAAEALIRLAARRGIEIT